MHAEMILMVMVVLVLVAVAMTMMAVVVLDWKLVACNNAVSPLKYKCNTTETPLQSRP
jgi:hypothetical protein